MLLCLLKSYYFTRSLMYRSFRELEDTTRLCVPELTLAQLNSALQHCVAIGSIEPLVAFIEQEDALARLQFRFRNSVSFPDYGLKNATMTAPANFLRLLPSLPPPSLPPPLLELLYLPSRRIQPWQFVFSPTNHVAYTIFDILASMRRGASLIPMLAEHFGLPSNLKFVRPTPAEAKPTPVPEAVVHAFQNSFKRAIDKHGFADWPGLCSFFAQVLCEHPCVRLAGL